MTLLTKGWRIAATMALVLTIAVLRAGPASAATPPANDDFDHATVIATTPFTDTVDTSGATVAGDDPTTCGTLLSTVWYSFTPSVNETVIVDTNGSGFTNVSAYTGSRGALTQVACGSSFGPTTQWSGAAGVTYHIMASAQFGTGGVLTLHVTAALPPPNDDFDHATVIAATPFTDTVDNTGATSAADDPSACGGTGHSVWYAFTPSVNESVYAAASGGGGLPDVSAYSGTRGALTELACGEFQNQASWSATAGVTYHIMVVSMAPFNGGTLTLNVASALPPANDDFDHATTITALPFTTTEAVGGATTAADDPTTCAGNKNTVWFRFTPSVSETYFADGGASNYQPLVSVFTGTRGALTAVGCPGGPFATLTKWSGTAGVTYYIMVANGSPNGPFSTDQLGLTVTGKAPPANDDFNHATVVTALPFTDSIDASAATAAAGDPAGCGSTDSSVWYSLTPPTNELVTADTTGSTYTPIVSVYTGARGSLTQVACGSFGSTTSFHATAGVTYHIMVANFPFFGTARQLMLHLTGILPPANDDISHATVITSLPFTDHPDTTAATTVASDPASCLPPPAATVWYKFTAPASGIVTLNTTASGFPVAVSAYTGSPGALTQVACGSGSTTLGVAKGVTYYFMVSTAFGFTAGGPLTFTVTALPDIATTSACTTLITGKVPNGVTVRSGTTCIGNATINGGVTVSAGGQLLAINDTISGSVTSDGAAALVICNSSISGGLTVRGSTGPVLVGDGGDGSGCAGNKIGAAVRLGEGNTSGLELGGNTIVAGVTVTGNTPNPATVLTAEDASIEIEANHIGAGLSCAHNGTTPVNDGLPNTVGAVRSGQCQGL